MKVVFMGTPEFACAPLVCLMKSEHDICAVVTGPDEPLPRSGKYRPTAVCVEAERHGLKVMTVASLRDPLLYNALQELEPDLFLVVAFKILPKKLFSLPRLGSINIHASLLPKYRGAAPINWALINGDKETGLTSFILKQKVDTGDIVLQERVAIGDDENFDSLYGRLSDLSGPFMLRSIERIVDPQFQPKVQEHCEACPAPKITPDDAMIDFGFPAINVHNFVRGLSSRPGAYTYFRGIKVKIFESAVVSAADGSQTNLATHPGSIVPDRKRLLIQCADAAIEIRRIMPQGKCEMDGQSFCNGYRPTAKELFGKAPRVPEEKE